MSYSALYRKFRPDNFHEVKGQDHIVITLKNQILGNRLGHAYLFCGTRGTGKTSVAKLFAKAVNCEAPVEGSPCGSCASCRSIAAGVSMNVIEIDAASNNGVDSIREIVEEVAYSPAEGRYKVYIIDEVHMLSIGAFNALLKTLEEPPSYVIFILATTEVHKLPITILSRCQRYDFRRITVDTIAARLHELMEAEGIRAEGKALRYVAKAADGSLRDALSLLDQCIAFHYGQALSYDKALEALGAADTEVFSRLFGLVRRGDVRGGIGLLEEVLMLGRELAQFVTDFTWYLRNLLLVKTADAGEEFLELSHEHYLRLREEAADCETETLLRYIRIFSETASQIKYAAQKRILVEIALIKLCRPQMETDAASLSDRIRNLEEKWEQGLPAPAGAGASAEPAKAPPKREESPGPQPLPRAVPEEIRRLAAKWPTILTGAGVPLRACLKDAKLSLGESGKLLILIENHAAYDYLAKSEDGYDRVRQLLEAYLEKTVEFELRPLQDRNEMENRYPDLSKLIHMEIEEED